MICDFFSRVYVLVVTNVQYNSILSYEVNVLRRKSFTISRVDIITGPGKTVIIFLIESVIELNFLIHCLYKSS